MAGVPGGVGRIRWQLRVSVPAPTPSPSLSAVMDAGQRSLGTDPGSKSLTQPFLGGRRGGGTRGSPRARLPAMNQSPAQPISADKSPAMNHEPLGPTRPSLPPKWGPGSGGVGSAASLWTASTSPAPFPFRTAEKTLAPGSCGGQGRMRVICVPLAWREDTGCSLTRALPPAPSTLQTGSP